MCVYVKVQQMVLEISENTKQMVLTGKILNTFYILTSLLWAL